MSMQKAMYAVDYTIYGPAIQVPMPKGKGDTALFYRDKALKKAVFSKTMAEKCT